MELHSEEYAAMSPTTLEVIYLKVNYCLYDDLSLFSIIYGMQAQGLIQPQQPANPTTDTSKKITGT